jgi:hypothetical protein
MKIKYLTIILISILLACNKSNKGRRIFDILDNYEIEYTRKSKFVVFIVPVSGCSTCLGAVKEFIAKIDSKSKFVILSAYTIKDIKLAFPENDWHDKIYLTDTLALAYKNSLVDVGAKVFFFDDKELIDSKLLIKCDYTTLENQINNFIEKD